MVAMEYCKHEVLVLERGQNLFTVDHARAMEAMEKPLTMASNGGDGIDKHDMLVLAAGQTSVAPSMRERWWRWINVSTSDGTRKKSKPLYRQPCSNNGGDG
eukprot:CAMPEP_0171723806 /NCGR_PEP_ID=MMETSP0991-20121206/23927_1 /TAXON_ID=483369 /ORGANISM="non described non described, Strain CCMP2098" /LENGTH=100 /DNA_ID=CAMNT_0012316443 /DNA_START=1067 /DNA_END=1370 /DNA_ORIENTATION=+